MNYQGGIAEVDTWDHFVNHEATEEGSSDVASNEADLAALQALLAESEEKDSQFVMRKDTQKE